MWAKTHHTLGKTKKNDVTRPVQMLNFDAGAIGDRDGDENKSFASFQWTHRKIIENAMGHILAIEQSMRRIQRDEEINMQDPQLMNELEAQRVLLSDDLQLSIEKDATWRLIGCLSFAKGKRMVLRAFNVLDKGRLGVFLCLIFRNIAHFLFSRVETKELLDINELISNTIVNIIDSVQVQDLPLLSKWFDALVETQAPRILKYYIGTKVSAQVVETLILHGTDLVGTAKESETFSSELQDAIQLWEATAMRLTNALQAE